MVRAFQRISSFEDFAVLKKNYNQQLSKMCFVAWIFFLFAWKVITTLVYLKAMELGMMFVDTKWLELNSSKSTKSNVNGVVVNGCVCAFFIL